jgi:Clostripain family
LAAKWTVMVYMAGNNSLSDAAGEDLEEMHHVGASEELRVLCFMKQRDGSGAFHIELGARGRDDEREPLGDVDSGDPQTLVDFVRWAAGRAPAERYALVLWNHGGGFAPDDLDQLYSEVRGARGPTGVSRRELNRRANQPLARLLFSSSVKTVLAEPDEGTRQICNDDGTGHSLDTLELENVLSAATEAIEGPLDLLGMDACLMSNFEVGYQVRALARVVVGSEDLEPGAGWPYERVLGDLAARPEMDAAELGELIVRHYVDSYRERPDQWPVTQAALDAAAVEEFAAAVGRLGDALREELGRDWREINRAHALAIGFDMELVDLRSFCANLQNGELSEPVKRAAGDVLEALEPGGYVLAHSELGPKVEGCGGTTVYLPQPSVGVSRYYADLAFAADEHWDEALERYHDAVRGGVSANGVQM